MNGGMNLNWTNFKEKYLFSINFCFMLSVIIYGAGGGVIWYSGVLALLILSLLSDKVRSVQKKFPFKVGLFNSQILLFIFYFFFFTPFSIFYRLFFRNKAFLKTSSRFIPKESISDFSRPF